MDITSLIGTLLSSDSVSGVSKSTKASSSDVQSVLTAALPLLLNGAKQQAEDESTAESFASALLSHGKKDTSNLGSFLSAVDMDDGAKIIGHLLGNDDSAVKEIAKESGVSAKTTSSVLSAAAPLLMSLLGQSSDEEEKKKKSGAGGGIALALAAGVLLKNVDFGGLLGGLLDVSADEEEVVEEEEAPKKKTTKKTTTTKKASTAKKSSTAKKASTTKKTTASKKASPAKSSTKKTSTKKASTKKAADEDEGSSTAELLGDLLGSLLK